MATELFGIDLSYANKITDYKKLLASTYGGRKISFAFLRIGYPGKVDTRFFEHYNALSGKVKLGVYFYSLARSVEEARAEARFVLDKIKGLKLEYPVVFDYEDKRVLSPKLSKGEYTAICSAFLAEIKAGGYYAMLYSNPSFLESYADKGVLLKNPLWLAHYTANGKQRQYGQQVWQFGTFRSAGAVGKVDGNIAYCDLAQLIANAGQNVPRRCMLTAQKTVYAWERADEIKRLRELGCTVGAKKSQQK